CPSTNPPSARSSKSRSALGGSSRCHRTHRQPAREPAKAVERSSIAAESATPTHRPARSRPKRARSEATPRGVGPRSALPNGARGAIPSCDNLGPRSALPNGARGASPSCDNLGPRSALPNGARGASPSLESTPAAALAGADASAAALHVRLAAEVAAFLGPATAVAAAATAIEHRAGWRLRAPWTRCEALGIRRARTEPAAAEPARCLTGGPRRRLVVRVVDAEPSTAHLVAVQPLDRRGARLVRRELDERKAARLPGLAVHPDACLHDRAGRREELLELLLGG